MILLVLLLGIEHISEAAVDAGHRLPTVQVDVDLGVAESTTTSVTGNLQI